MSYLKSKDIVYLQGVGPKRGELLRKEAGISSYEDLLYYFPYKYVDKSSILKVADITAEESYIQLKGRFLFFETISTGRTQRYTARFTDGSGFLDLVWFNGIRYVKGKLSTEKEYILFGKPVFFNGRCQIVHPEVELFDQMNTLQGLSPQYSVTEKMKQQGLTSKLLTKLVKSVFESMGESVLQETLPEDILSLSGVMPLHKALYNIHFPTASSLLKQAQYRFKLEEFFYIQLKILFGAKKREQQSESVPFPIVGEIFNRFYKENLPFALTEAQKRVLKEIRKDVGKGVQMNRLLQGDVGSGKTIVALMAMLLAVDNRCQACLMAPTEILATQHYHSLKELLNGLPVRVELLTGSTKSSIRKEIDQGLRDHLIHILIGTHALIEDTVSFSRLALAVIDEQHRFGVAQRAKLHNKHLHPPHILVMTATPIPRTLAMTLYGDLEVSVLDELPPGRKPIQTLHIPEGNRNYFAHLIQSQLKKGHQVYVVYPLISESEKLDYRNLEEGFVQMKELFPHHKVVMVHGKMKSKEKEEQMALFVSHKADILVSTTVIEVGVNVPNASVMVIESAQRFGLSQLHQLRGRVGRGAAQSYCVLITTAKLSSDGRKRMEIMTSTNDGFEIAEADLQIRGPGDLAGTQQSGLPFTLKIADLGKDGQILSYARTLVTDLLCQDPDLSSYTHSVAKKELLRISGSVVDWSKIS